MKTKILSHNLVRLLVIVALSIPLALGGLSPAMASFDSSEIVGWGYNANGEFTTPSDLTDVIAIAVGGFHNLALRSDGTVVAWGTNYHGQCDVPTDLSGVVAIAAGEVHSLALKSDGTVVAWGENAQGQCNVPSALTDVVAIDAGEFHSLARKSDGTFVGWGNNSFDQITFPPGLEQVVAFDVGSVHNLAIRADGTVIGWGYNLLGETNVPAGLSDVVAVAAGSHHSLALKSDGTVVGWGNNASGQTNVPSGLTGVVAIAAGGVHSLALKNDGTVVGWGENSYGQSTPPPDVTGAVAIDAGYWHSLAVVPADAPIVYDNFDDNLTDPSLWSIELKDSGPTVSEVNHRLEITVPADSAGDDFAAWYDSACQLRGDYDIQVDYDLLTWPSANGVRIGLADDHANMQRISSGRQPYDYPGGPDLYLTTFDTADHVVGITPTSDLSGKLRLERVDDTLSTYYFANGAWTLVASYSDPAYTQDTAFYLGSWSADSVFADQEVKLAFDNLIINKGELVCPPATAPDLAITQVADQERVSTGDPVGFTITVTNNGNGTASSVTLADTLPTAADLSWSVDGTDAASCTITAGVVSCNFGDMPPGAVKTIRLTSPTQWYDKVSCRTISSTATVMAYNQPEGRSATASTTVLCPNVYINVWAENPSYPAGSPISFTTEFGNLGDGVAKDVLAEATLPTNPGLSWSIMSIIPAEAADNCFLGTDAWGTYELICSFDQLPAGQVVTITLTSPTTSDSCGFINSVGYLSLSNGRWSRSVMKPPIVTCPALMITKTADAGPFSAGEHIGFTIQVSNPYPVSVSGVTLVDTFPTIPMEWLIDQEVSPECSLESGAWICNVGTMAPNTTYSVHIFAASSSSTCGRVVENSASVTDSRGSSSSASDSLVVNCPDLTVTNTAASETVSTGDPIRFDITIANDGAGTAMDVALSDTLPTAADLSWSVDGTDAASCTITAGVVSCDFGDMPPGAVKTVRLTSPTQWYDKYSCRTISSIATVMAYNQPEGRSVTASTTVLCPNVYIEEWAETPSVTVGDPISFTVKFGNMGEGIARDVLAEATLPTNPGLSWSIMSIIPAEAANNCLFGTDPWGTYELMCSYDQLTAGQEVTITLTSPTTVASCGWIESTGYMTISNGRLSRSRIKPPLVNCTVNATVQPGEAATLTLLNGRGQIELPADLVTVQTRFTYTEQDAPSQAPGSYTFAGLSFTLDATDSGGNPVTSFPASYTIRLSYQDSDWQSAGIAAESLLNLAYWNTANGQWVKVLPCEGCSLDTEQNRLVAVLNHLTEFALLASPDTTPPTTSASILPEASASGWHTGPVMVTLTASDSDSGVHDTEYNLNGAGWTTYSAPFDVSSESTSSTVHNTVQYRSTDEAGNTEETKSLTIQIDTTPPTVGAGVPLVGTAVQGGIKFGVNLADALSGPAGATLSIREANGASGKEIGYENLAAVYNSTLGNWELAQTFDTTQLPDGFYVLVATGKDVAGNEKTEIIPFSVRNWAVLELLPSTEDNKAGRTMPVKFSLRVVQEVDPAQPFVYSEELTITIYEAGKPTPVLQCSTFGSGARDYRINAAEQTYITNFRTLKEPMHYTVEILRGALSIGTFGFQTTK